MDVLHHIKDLLLKRNGLVIPQLGSFIVQYLPAEVDRENNKILPPRRKVAFKPEVKEDPEMILVKQIAAKKNISIEKAKAEIEAFVTDIKDKIEKNNKVELEGLGFLYKTDESREIIFKQEEKKALTNLGMEPLDTESFELDKTEHVSKKQPSRQEVQPRTTTRPQQLDKVSPTTKRKGKPKIYISIAAAVILLMFIFTGIYTGFFEYYIDKFSEKGQLTQEKERTKANENTSEALPADTATGKKLEETINKMTDKKRALMYKNQSTTQYYLIAGSFQRRQNAEEYRQKLLKDDYSPKILEKDGLFRVSLRSFNTKEDALVSLYHLRDTSRFKSAWLLTLEKDQ